MLEKTLFACDELSGFITAISRVRPIVDVPSVRKKMKEKGFARSVSREDILEGAHAMGMELDEHIQFCIVALNEAALKDSSS
jgi:predicted hydrolase (HD superfamily)